MPDTQTQTENSFGLGSLAKYGNTTAMLVIVAFLFLLRGDLKEAVKTGRDDMRYEREQYTESMKQLGGKVDSLTAEIRKLNGGR